MAKVNAVLCPITRPRKIKIIRSVEFESNPKLSHLRSHTITATLRRPQIICETCDKNLTKMFVYVYVNENWDVSNIELTFRIIGILDRIPYVWPRG